MRSATSALIAAAMLLPAASALRISEGSPCVAECGNINEKTLEEEMVCQQEEYSSTDEGQRFVDCLSCLSTSVYAAGSNETDSKWMLYNLRYAMSYCLFGVPGDREVDTTQCMTSEGCGRYRDSITYKNMSADVGAYEYCDDWPSDDAFRVEICQECLQLSSGPYMANYMITLHGGCRQQPEPGLMVGLDGDIFLDDHINATAPSSTASVNPEWFDDGPLTLPIKVAIAFGGFVLLLMALGAFIICNGRRRRRAYLRKIESRYNKKGPSGASSPHREMLKSKGWVAQQLERQPRETHETPMSQRPLRGWDDSPMTAATEEKPFQRYFSPYSSQYNSPVSAHDTPAPQWQAPVPQNIGVALGGDDSSGRWSPPSPDVQRRPSTPESYELRQVDSGAAAIPPHPSRQGSATYYPPPPPPQPPTLGHPGYGRPVNFTPSFTASQHGLSEEDMRNGRAF